MEAVVALDWEVPFLGSCTVISLPLRVKELITHVAQPRCDPLVPEAFPINRCGKE